MPRLYIGFSGVSGRLVYAETRKEKKNDGDYEIEEEEEQEDEEEEEVNKEELEEDEFLVVEPEDKDANDESDHEPNESEDGDDTQSVIDRRNLKPADLLDLPLAPYNFPHRLVYADIATRMSQKEVVYGPSTLTVSTRSVK
ncbi:hypothetical protein ACHAPJ_007176 [Fusarium lateritium]